MKNTHGGARPGSGRKPIPEKDRKPWAGTSFRCDIGLLRAIDNVAGGNRSAWIVRALTKALEEE